MNYSFVLIFLFSFAIVGCSANVQKNTSVEVGSKSVDLSKNKQKKGFFLGINKSFLAMRSRQQNLEKKRIEEKKAFKKRLEKEREQKLIAEEVERQRILNEKERQEKFNSIMSGTTELVNPPSSFTNSREQGKIYGNRQQVPLIINSK